MKILKFKTNIKSSNQVAEVSNYIDKYDEVVNWEVDTASSDSILTVRGQVTEARVLGAVKRAGFQIAAAS